METKETKQRMFNRSTGSRYEPRATHACRDVNLDRTPLLEGVDVSQFEHAVGGNVARSKKRWTRSPVPPWYPRWTWNSTPATTHPWPVSSSPSSAA
jgi:hypothetical protein